MTDPIAQAGTPDIATLRRKYLGQSDCDKDGLDSAFFDGVKWRAEIDVEFRTMLKASMDAYWDEANQARSEVINGKLHIYDKSGKLVGIQG